MKMLKKIAAGIALAAGMLSAAQASPINVAGVVWNPDALTDFSSQSSNMRQFINPVDGTLSGFGIINAFNGTAQPSFCPGCELTFQFSGFTPVGGTLIPGVGQTITYHGGIVNVFVGAVEILSPFDYTALTWANTGNGTLFLSLANNYDFLGSHLFGGLLAGLGFLDVTGGAAAGNFDTDTQAFGSDLRFSTSLTFDHIPGQIIDMSGTGNLRGDTIPEPESLALVGLALLGLAATRRRKLV
jgi:hypothetical protein